MLIAVSSIPSRQLSTKPGQLHYARRTIHWLLFDRSGLVDSRELDLPTVAIWQALTHVERLLRERGIRLAARDQSPE